MHEDKEVTHILWTGGWDSTYRLLYLLQEGRTVQPHYILDKGRPSTECELRAMDAIRKRILECPQIKGELLPTEISDKSQEIETDSIQRAYEEVLKTGYIGEQYMWLADYCATRRIVGMEIGVEKNPIILDAVQHPGYPYSEIFGRFSFPILDTAKLEMKQWAVRNGLLSILEESWFCHTPTAQMEPCGVCHPCEVTIKGGMQYRLPLRARIRHSVRVVPRLRSFLKTFPRMYFFLYRLKHNRSS